jgi:superfamily II DNA or RNA helicase
MKVELRDYQTNAINDIRARFINGDKRICLVAPTGAGKTTIAAEIIKRTIESGKRVLFMAHRTELIDQCAARLDMFGVPIGIIKSGTKRANPRAPVQVASVQTLIRRALPEAHLVIVDECHRVMGRTYLEVLGGYPEARVIGLTATPIRLDGKGINDVFQGIVEASKVSSLVEQNVLVKPRVFGPSSPDLTGVKMTAGDFNQKQLSELMNKQGLVGSIVDTYIEKTVGRRAVCFATSVEHSLHIIDEFKRRGVSAEHLDGETPAEQRSMILKRLADGAIDVVSNVNVLTEGWDCPNVEVVILARPTASLSMYLQMVGRGVRSASGKTGATVLDHAGNTIRHGFSSEDRNWENLWSSKEKQKVARESSAKSCPVCFCIVQSGVMSCPECGHEFAAEKKERKVRTASGELVEYDENLFNIECFGCKEYNRKEDILCHSCNRPVHVKKYMLPFLPQDAWKPTLDEKQRWYDHCISYSNQKNYNSGWVAHEYKRMFGVWPRAKILNRG